MKSSKKKLQIQRRECVFQQLFLSEFYSADDMPAHFSLFLEDSDLLNELELDSIEEMSPEERSLLQARCEQIVGLLPVLDEKINAVSEGWRTGRMSRVDLSLIRLALYEMLYDGEIPYKVAINEAVELAKKYGGSESPAFVNAILGKLAADLPEDGTAAVTETGAEAEMSGEPAVENRDER